MSANGAECRGIPRSSPKGAVAAAARAVALKGRKARVRRVHAAASFALSPCDRCTAHDMQHFLRFPCSIAARLAREIEKMPRSDVPL
jgi:hypothetical protein